MSESEKQAIVENDAPTVVEERQQTAGPSARPACSAEQAGLGRADSKEEDASQAESSGNGNDEAKSAKAAGLCHHAMENGFYCQSPALRHRRYCYSHLRLLGQRLRMARAIARRQPYRFDLPALDDLFAVQAAVEHVARALGAGLLERRQAGTLLYALQQSAINHRIMALVQMDAASSAGSALSNPTLSPTPGDNHPDEGKSGPRWGPRSGGAPVIFQDVVHSIGTREADCAEQSSFRGATEWTFTRMPDLPLAVERLWPKPWCYKG